MRHLLLCLFSVAVLSRWLARPSPAPFHMLIKVIVYQSPVVLELRETPEGASFHLSYPQMLGGGGGSGTLSAGELRQFLQELEVHGMWNLPSKPSSKDRVLMILTQGDRHHRVVLSNQDKLGEWLFAPKGLVLSCFEKACQCPD